MNRRLFLIPCPACGSEAELKHSVYFDSEVVYSSVHCTNKQCQKHEHNPLFWGRSAVQNDEKAIFSWNAGYPQPLRSGIEKR